MSSLHIPCTTTCVNPIQKKIRGFLSYAPAAGISTRCVDMVIAGGDVPGCDSRGSSYSRISRGSSFSEIEDPFVSRAVLASRSHRAFNTQILQMKYLYLLRSLTAYKNFESLETEEIVWSHVFWSSKTIGGLEYVINFLKFMNFRRQRMNEKWVASFVAKLLLIVQNYFFKNIQADVNKVIKVKK